MKIDLEKIFIKVKILQDENTKAIISVDFGDFVVKGFRVQKSQFENYKGDLLWITPPSYRGGPKWHPIFFMPDKELWNKFETKLWEEYYKQSDEFYKKFMGVTDEDLKDIP